MNIINIKVECPFFSFEQNIPENKSVTRLKQIKQLFVDMKTKFEGEPSKLGRGKLWFSGDAKLKVTTSIVNPQLF